MLMKNIIKLARERGYFYDNDDIFVSIKKILGGKWPHLGGKLGATMLWGVYGGIMGPPEIGDSLGSMKFKRHQFQSMIV